jgi:hypothetical protein
MVLIRDIIIRRTKKLSKIFINFPKILFKKWKNFQYFFKNKVLLIVFDQNIIEIQIH